MIAQKLKNNKIAIGNSAPRKDAIEIIEDLRVGEFFSLTRAARNWNESLNDKRDLIFTSYENEHSKICKEFDRIYARRKLFIEKMYNENKIGDDQINKKEEKVSIIKQKPKFYKSTIVGTSKLFRIPSKQIIKIAKRKNSKDSNNSPNSVCISNQIREEFFQDCKKSKHYQCTKLYELLYSKEDKKVYEKYDALIDNIYKEGIKKENINENN